MTEAADPRYADLDARPALEALGAMWQGQRAAIAALEPQLAQIAQICEAIAGVLRAHPAGRLAYAGAGTSARIAVQDGAELYPTFNWPRDRVAFLIAGGAEALVLSAEGAEDSAEAASAAVAQERIGPGDVLLGVAASGRTPYTCAALSAARAAGALTIGVANNPGTPVLELAEHGLLLDTGAEVLAGSTRMQAGTAQKAALNMISTQVMIELGLVYRGRMVAMRPSNDKLRARAVQMICDLLGTGAPEAQAALERANWDLRLALLLASGLPLAEAQARLAAAGGDLRAILGSDQ